jgi:glycerol-3-phosphate acyltransferase PlsX
VGNIVLKTVESLAVAMFSMLKRELMHTTQRKFGAFLAKGAFHAIRKRMDPDVHGGAPMLGFNGMVFKSHGSARERAVTSAIRVSVNAVRTQINQTIARDIAAANEKLAIASANA